MVSNEQTKAKGTQKYLVETQVHAAGLRGFFLPARCGVLQAGKNLEDFIRDDTMTT